MSYLNMPNFVSTPSSMPKLEPTTHFPQVNPLAPGLKLLEIPSPWKDANITTIFEKGHSADPKNYRPVLLTFLIAKSMEHIISKQIYSHLSGNSVISQHQHGFQIGLSCETQLHEEPQAVIFLHGIWRHIKELELKGKFLEYLRQLS